MIKCNICGGEVINQVCKHCGYEHSEDKDTQLDFYLVMKSYEQLQLELSAFDDVKDKYKAFELFQERLEKHQYEPKASQHPVLIAAKLLEKNDHMPEDIFLAGALMRNFMDMDMKSKEESMQIISDRNNPLLGKKRILKLYFNDRVTEEAIKLLNAWFFLNEEIIHGNVFNVNIEKLLSIKNQLQKISKVLYAHYMIEQ